MSSSSTQFSLSSKEEMEDSTGSIVDLFKSLDKMSRELEAKWGTVTCCATTSEDMSHKLDSWHANSFLPAIRHYERSKQKSLEKAFEYEKMEESFAEMQGSDTHFTGKAFEFINKAIRFAPHDERNLLSACFMKRSELHVYNENYDSALLDIENALHFRAHSFTAIVYKIDILKCMEKYADAYRFVSKILSSSMAAEKFRKRNHDKLKDIKQRLESKFNQSDESEPNELSDEAPPPFVRADERIRLYKDPHNQRFGLKAIEEIKPDVTLLEEKPLLFVLEPAGLNSLCAQCWSTCSDTFWSCGKCTEVIYCSKACAQANANEHSAECRLYSLFQKEISTKALQVYRHLTRLGHEQWLEFDREQTSCALDKHFDEIIGNENVDWSQLENIFVRAQSDLLHLISERKRPPSVAEYSAAIFILSMYAYKKGLSLSSLSIAQKLELIRIFTIDLMKVSINEYSWKDKSGAKLASFQCTFASRVGHWCESNAGWYFDGNHFVLRSHKPIQAHQPITISFGISQRDPFLVRQVNVRNFLILCSCPKCMQDVRTHFCLRCDSCGGPVPWHETQFPNDRCMVCERHCASIQEAKPVKQGLMSTQKAIWLLRLNSNDTENIEQELKTIEAQMSTLSDYIYYRNESFLSVVRELCELYFSLDSFERPVQWYQWLASEHDIFLSPLKDVEGQDDRLVSFKFLDTWINAYESQLEEDSLSFTDKTEYMTILIRLIECMIDTLQEWKFSPKDALKMPVSLAGKYCQVESIMSDVLDSKLSRCKQLAVNLVTGLTEQDSVGQELEIYITALAPDLSKFATKKA